MSTTPPKAGPETCWLLQYPRPRLTEEIAERFLRSPTDLDDTTMIKQIRKVSGDKVVCETTEGLVSYPLKKLLSPPLYHKVKGIIPKNGSKSGS